MSILNHLTDKLREQQGFTLLEVLMAMVVGTIGLLAVAMMQGNAIEGNASGNKFTQATFLAQDMLENIKDGNPSTAFGLVDMSEKSEGTQLDAGPPENVKANGDAGGPFIRSWRVESLTPWSRRIVVTVRWNNDLGRDRSVVLTSVSRGGYN
jgi:prepilin-type N-terminal cleavage/methylation domain-containing protein